MDHDPMPEPDAEQFRRVWQRVMPADRPDCPFTLDPPLPAPMPPPMPMPPQAPAQPVQRREPPLYLGEDCAGDLPMLARLLCLTEESRTAYGALKARRRGHGWKALPGQLHTAKEAQLRRLGAAYFLIAGEPCDLPSPGGQMVWASLPLAVRDCYRREQRAALRFFTAANSVCSPYLIDLFREIGKENQAHAEQLRAWLEQM